MMDLGKVSITPKGEYVLGKYERLDLVTQDGSSYLSLVDNNISTLDNLNSWQVIAEKGDSGDSAYEAYVQTTADDPVLNIEQWAKNKEEGIKGIATTATVPSPTEFERYIVHEAGTYTNFLSGGSPIVVTAADLDVVNGVANNRVILAVQDGVATKRVERVKGDAGAVPTVQTKGTSTTDVMSQKAVTDEFMDKENFLASEEIASENLFNKDAVTAGHLGADGITPTASSSYRMSDPITVKSGTEYIRCVPNEIISGFVYQYNSSDVLLTVTSSGNFTTQATCAYVRIVVNITTKDINEVMLLERSSSNVPTSYIPYGSITDYSTIKNDFLDLRNDLGTDNAPATQALVTSLLEEREILSPNLFNIATATNGHLGSDGMTPTASANHRMSAPLYLPKGQMYIKCVPSSLNSGYNYFFDENDNVISITTNNRFTTPLDYSYCRVVYNVSSVDPNSLMLLRSNPAYVPTVFYPYGEVTQEYSSIKESIAPAKVYNKYIAIGDSITWGYAPRNIELLYPDITSSWQIFSYSALFAEKHSNSFYNAGISGSTLAAKTVGTTDNYPMVYRIAELPNDADLITIMGGCNDIRQSIPLGTFADTSETTYYGALHSICQQLIEKYVTNRYNSELEPANIYLITPTKFLQGAGQNYDVVQKSWANAVKEVAAHYSIPVIDFHNESGLTPHVGRIIQGTHIDANKMYNPYMLDGIHITPKGYEEILYPFFKKQLE